MDFSFSDEQTLLQDTIARYIQNEYSFETRQKIVQEEIGYSTAVWKKYAELGWLGVPFPEEDGGFDGTAVEGMIMLEQFGKGLVVEPFLATVVLAGGALKIGGSRTQKGKYLSGVIDGSLQGALAYAEPQGRFNLADLITKAEKDGDGYLINGYKAVVLNGPSANFFVVSARTSGKQRDTQGVSLFLVDADTPGISRRDYPTVDAMRAS
ncbi:MAG: acyl-CoA/acyl-ACP dehydrogenase, partial [Gammaproteobacteria bacterium]|nr:acyl-CoA/acyl-ACP dehydrogenase [Gammaproteobacteria bacterium]